MGIQHPFRPAGGSRGVAERSRGQFIERRPAIVYGPLLQQIVIKQQRGQLAERCFAAGLHQHDVFYRRQVRQQLRNQWQKGLVKNSTSSAASLRIYRRWSTDSRGLTVCVTQPPEATAK